MSNKQQDIRSLAKDLAQGIFRHQQDKADIRPLRQEILWAECDWASFEPVVKESNRVPERSLFFAVLERLIAEADSWGDNDFKVDATTQEASLAFQKWLRAKEEMAASIKAKCEKRVVFDPKWLPGPSAPLRASVKEFMKLHQRNGNGQAKRPSEEARKTRREEAEKRRDQLRLLQIRVRGGGAVVEALLKDEINPSELEQLVTELSHPREFKRMDKRYFAANAASVNTSFATRRQPMVKVKEEDDKKKNKRKGGKRKGGKRR